MMVHSKFQSLKFGSIPFIGIGEAHRISLSDHPYLNVPVGISRSKCPWNSRPSTMIGLQKNGTVFAAFSVDGKKETNMPNLQLFNTSVSQTGFRSHKVSISVPPTPASYIPHFNKQEFELRMEATPQIFSMIPLEVTYTIELTNNLKKVPVSDGGVMMDNTSSQRSMNGQIHVPAGLVVDLGPILKIMVKKRKDAVDHLGNTSHDSHLITRNVSLGIRKRLYG